MNWEFVIVLGLAFAPLRAGPAATPEPLTVCAAISLTESLEAAAAAYQQSGGGPVRFNFAGSNTLARQLVNGAPADLFISADEQQMEVAAAAGAIDRTTRIDLVENRLALMVRPDHGAIRTARDLVAPAVRRVAIGDPAAVPAGVYARRYLEAAGLWDAVQPRLVPVGNVRAAVTAVQNGSVDAAIVYATDVAIAGNTVRMIPIEGAGTPRVVYPAAVVERSRNRAEAARLLAFLGGPAAARIFARYHFTPIAR
jgi:molybdate transport system substrate-binding protein